MVAVKKIVVFFAKGSVLAAAIVLITAATLKVQSPATFRDTLAAHQVLPPPTWDAAPWIIIALELAIGTWSL